ncbi:hypothetical protein CCACVL1_13305 [Corchorus capsularis]|uniref:HMA domain-containing protein n=1 Tax=Corchorus capsularis TaxID=210143 RepID=A0A1R3IBC2_COCAP|nr:hypothetical protein CCACVL1_13305 [Corchorus capsularis]
MATLIARAFNSIISAITYCFFGYRDHEKKPVTNINYYNMPKGRPLSLQTVDLKVRMCCTGCERVVKNAIYKLRGIDSVEVDLEMEKVTVIGYVDRNKVLKQVRRAGKRAEFWPYPDVPLYFTSTSEYFRDTTNEFKESYNYYRHGYNQGHRHGNIPVTHRGDDKVSNLFNDDNVNACCLIMQRNSQAFCWVVLGFGRMMTESTKAINVFSNSTSSSRLSPLALPFTLNNSLNRQESFDPLLNSSSPSTSSTSGLDQPFSYLSLGRGYYISWPSDADSTFPAALASVYNPDFEPNSPFAYNLFEESPLRNHFISPTHQFSQTSSSLGNVGYNRGLQGIAVNQQGSEIFNNNDQIQRRSDGSLSCTCLLEQGTTVEGSKHFSKMSPVSHGKGTEVIRKDVRTRPADKEKIHTESSILPLANSEVDLLNKCTSSALSFSPRPQDTLNQLSYSGPLMTWSHCDPTIVPNERSVSHLGSCEQVSKENVVSVGSDVVNNMNSYFGHVLPSMMDTYMVQNPLDKVACHDQVIIENSEKRKVVEHVHDESKYPSIKAKSKLQIACTNVSEDLSLEQHGAKAAIPDNQSSTNFDDSDVDSPCWKGTQAYKSPFRDSMAVNSEDSNGQSPSRVSVPLKSGHSKNETVARNSLNPLAPVFIPGNSKLKVDYHQKECHGDSSSSSQKIAPLDGTSSSREHKSTKSVIANTCPPERINDIEPRCSNDASDSKKEYSVPYKHGSSAVDSSGSFQPYLRVQYVTSESQVVIATSVAGSTEGIATATSTAIHNALDRVEDIAHIGRTTGSSVHTTEEIALNIHSIGVDGDGFSDFTQRLPKLLNSMPPKIDVKSIINTMQYLSELLLLNSSFDLGSLSEHENDKLLNIINMLYVVRSKAGQIDARPVSSQ